MQHDLMVGVIAGVIAALASYFFGRIALKPRLHYSGKLRLRTYADDDDRELVQFRMVNTSYWRTITEIDFTAVVMVPFLDPQYEPEKKTSVLRIPITLSAEKALRLNPRQDRVTAFEPSKLHEFTKIRLRSLDLNRMVDDEQQRTITEFLKLELVPSSFREEKTRKVNPRAVKERYRSRLFVLVSCKDGITGRGFSFEFGPFYLEDVQKVRFGEAPRHFWHPFWWHTLRNGERRFRRAQMARLRFGPDDEKKSESRVADWRRERRRGIARR